MIEARDKLCYEQFQLVLRIKYILQNILSANSAHIIRMFKKDQRLEPEQFGDSAG